MPEREWILLNPGPANTSRSVRAALLMPDLCHREPEFFDMMRDCRERLVRAADCAERFAAVLFTGSGTAAVEAAVSSVVPEGRALLVVNNGCTGTAWSGWRGPRDPGRGAHLRFHDAGLSGGRGGTPRAPRGEPRGGRPSRNDDGPPEPGDGRGPDRGPSGSTGAHRRDELLFGERLDVDADGVDFVMASANKCLQAVPGIAFVLGAARRWTPSPAGRRAPCTWTSMPTTCPRNGTTRRSRRPVQVLHAMRQALVELEAEGSARIARYAENARVLRSGMTALGFEILVPEGARSNILTTFRLRPRAAYDLLHDAMKRRGYVIYAGQGTSARTRSACPTWGR